MLGLLAKFVNSEIMTKGGNAEPLDVTIGKRADAAGTTSGKSSLFAYLKSLNSFVTTNWTSARAGYLDQLVNWTSARAGYLDRLVNGGVPAVKSVQRGMHGADTTTINIAISSVNPLKCTVIVMSGESRYGGGSIYSNSTPYVKSLSATQLSLSGCCYSHSAGKTPVSFSWEVVEFY